MDTLQPIWFETLTKFEYKLLAKFLENIFHYFPNTVSKVEHVKTFGVDLIWKILLIA